MVWLGMGAKTGGLFTSFTTMVKFFASLNGGEPLSVTRTVIVFVPGPCASVGVQEKIAAAASNVALAGAPASRLYVSVFAGTSGSVAVFVKVSVVPSLIVKFGIGDRTGG